ncbi:hypothetical protein AOQ84DRAFT_363272 [Glonium stellatum]|uniref:Uncharacterized protein n=1 Tax=Glonium stellatum TaxID=574774 RepID=A0A8E2F371_9PEZI|nr:hypothetical protein AOQ84DRAFT_363272 [Glonium stellatum]
MEADGECRGRASSSGRGGSSGSAHYAARVQPFFFACCRPGAHHNNKGLSACGTATCGVPGAAVNQGKRRRAASGVQPSLVTSQIHSTVIALRKTDAHAADRQTACDVGAKPSVLLGDGDLWCLPLPLAICAPASESFKPPARSKTPDRMNLNINARMPGGPG